MQFDEIIEIQEIGYEDCYDITMYAADVYVDEPNFILDGVIVHNCGMHDAYCNRKKGKEKYAIPSALERYLDYTYGVMVYQEQVIRSLNIIGGIPERDCDILRKAISKKKMEKFEKYQKMFLENAQAKHGFTLDEAKAFWSQIESWSGYGFNKCVLGDTEVMDAETGEIKTVGGLYDNFKPFLIHCMDHDQKITKGIVTDVIDNGMKDVYVVTTRTGKQIKATKNHPFYTIEGWRNLETLRAGDCVALPRALNVGAGAPSLKDYEVIVMSWLLSEGNTCHPSTIYFYNNDLVAINDYINAASHFDNTVLRKYKRVGDQRWEVAANLGPGYGRFKKGNIPWNANNTVSQIQRCGLYDWCRSHGMIGKLATQKEIPSSIFTLDDRRLAIFFGRLWAGDGHVCSRKQFTPYYATSSEKMAKQVQLLLLRLGIISNLSKKSFKYRGTVKQGFTVMLMGENSIQRFCDIIGPHCVSKEFQIDRLKKHAGLQPSSRDLVPAAVLRDWRSGCSLTSRHLADLLNRSQRTFFESKGKKGFFRKTINDIGYAMDRNDLKCLGNSDIFWDEIISIEYYGKGRTYDLTVDRHHNFVANGIIVHNSHSVAYSYVSMQDLYLKTHFPIEFFVKSLQHNCVEGADRDKTFREYKRVIENAGIRVKRVDLNKSKVGFEIVDEQIYTGFSVLKGIGVDVAQKIVDGQPYNGFEDFLNRFGTQAKVVTALISLRLFTEAEPVTLYKFYEFSKDKTRKRADRIKRYNDSMSRYNAELRQLTEGLCDNPSFDDEETLERISESLDDDARKKLKAVRGRHYRSLKGHLFKSDFEDTNPVSLKDFDPSAYKVEIDEETMQLLTNKEAAERQFYGFCWTHPIEHCKDNFGLTIENYKADNSSPIEGLVTKIEERKGKKTNFYSLTLEDMNWETLRANIWMDDYKKFHRELSPGNIVRIRVEPPTPPYQTYTLESIPGYKPWMKKKPNLEHDYRVQLIQSAAAPVEQKKNDLAKEISEAIL